MFSNEKMVSHHHHHVVFLPRVGKTTRAEYPGESIRFENNVSPQPVRRPAIETVSFAERTPERKSRFLFTDQAPPLVGRKCYEVSLVRRCTAIPSFIYRRTLLPFRAINYSDGVKKRDSIAKNMK